MNDFFGVSSNGHHPMSEAVQVTKPITEAQKEIWIASQLGPEACCAFNLCYEFNIRGQLQLPSLHTALQKLIARHDALRLTFIQDGS